MKQDEVYIGSRYVPVFADDLWSDDREYEALTVVLHEGNSYTSRQFVPVGIDISNGQYWALTGNYNAQIDLLENDIQGISEIVDDKPFAFDTVALMQSCENLSPGDICHTNGFHASGDGGAAWYVISDSGTANGMDVIGIPSNESPDLYASLVVTGDSVTPEMFGAYGDGVHDDYDFIAYCITNSNMIVFSNKYNLSSSLEIYSPHAPNQENKHIINNGEIILNNSFIHIHGENIKFEGGIIKGNASGAMIYLGQTPDNENVSAIKCTIENVYFISNNETPAIVMYNAYKGNYGCYCNSIKNIYAYNTKNALIMIGDVNANNVIDVIQWSNADTVESLITFEGIIYNNITYAPKENNFAQLFYYKGIDTPTILYKANCSNGSYRNSFSNCTSEQMGNQSHFIEVENGVTAGKNIYVGITTNLYAGDFNSATKQRMIENDDTYIGSSNIFFGANSIFTKLVQLNNSLVIKNKLLNTFTKRQTENTDEILLTSGQRTPTGIDPMLYGGFIKVTLTEFYPNISRLQHTEEILIHVNANGVMSIANQITDSRFSISDNNIMYHTGNNGTSVSEYITCSYEVVCFNGNANYAFV